MEIEIVISDNCSTDNTEELCRCYTDKYENIRYFRNEGNIKDANFIKVLSLGNGEYLKLINDWASLKPDSLSYMLEIIRNNIADKPTLFFTSGYLLTKWKDKKDPIKCANLDEYIQVVSTYVTSILIFGVWKDQLALIQDPLKYSELLLNQVDWTFQLLTTNGCLIYNRPIIQQNNSMKSKPRGGYNWFQVHLDYYYKIMTPYINMGLVSNKTLEQDKRNLLQHFIPELGYSLLYTPHFWKFSKKDTWKILREYYSIDPFIVKITFLVLLRNAKSIVSTIIRNLIR